MSACPCVYDEYDLLTEVCREHAAATVQRTRNWYQARCGFATGSKAGDIIARTKSGWSTSRGNYMWFLMAERLTGMPQGLRYVRSLEERVDLEPEARAGYALYYDHEVAEVGFIWHPTIEKAGASPDGLVDGDGLLELKALDAAQHLRLLAGGTTEQEILDKYIPQCEFGMASTERQWCDFVSYCPFMKDEELRLYRRRIERDEDRIKKLETEVSLFLEELNEKVEMVRHRIRTGTDGSLLAQLASSLQMLQPEPPPQEPAEVIPIKTKRKRTAVE